MAAGSEVEGTIDDAWTAANAALDRAKEYSDKAVTYAQSITLPGSITDPSAPANPTIEAPPILDLDGIFSAEYNAEKEVLKDDLENRLAEFLTTYYPNYTTRLETVSSWINDSIANGGTGLPAAIEQQIWDRARSREDSTALKAENDTTQLWAARGFPLPPGAAAAQTMVMQQEVQHAVNGLSRDIAIKQAELELQNIQFAVSQGVNLHIGIIQIAQGYMNAIIGVSGQANSRASALVDSIKALYTMSVAYYQAQIASEDLTMRYEELRGTFEAREIDAAVGASRANIDGRVNAALAASQSMGEAAAAAIGSQNTFAGITNNTEE